jgi:hypothetical protein
MITLSANSNSDARFENIPTGVMQFDTGQSMLWKNDSELVLVISPEVFIALEYSSCKEVECVCVDHPEERGNEYSVITIVNERDPELRQMIYLRERAVMDAFPEFDFNFRIISRMNRNLSDVINAVGKVAYQR